jgi:hypothetical protein
LWAFADDLRMSLSTLRKLLHIPATLIDRAFWAQLEGYGSAIVWVR